MSTETALKASQVNELPTKRSFENASDNFLSLHEKSCFNRTNWA